MGQRRRNMEQQQQKLERQRQQLEEQQLRTRQNIAMKEEIMQRVHVNKSMAANRTKQDALDTKVDKQSTREAWLRQKEQKEAEAKNLKLMIRH